MRMHWMQRSYEAHTNPIYVTWNRMFNSLYSSLANVFFDLIHLHIVPFSIIPSILGKHQYFPKWKIVSVRENWKKTSDLTPLSTAAEHLILRHTLIIIVNCIINLSRNVWNANCKRLWTNALQLTACSKHLQSH